MSAVDVVLQVFLSVEERNPSSRPRSITMTWNSTGRGPSRPGCLTRRIGVSASAEGRCHVYIA